MLQIAATAIGVFYVIYEASYPYIYKTKAVKDRSEIMEAKYKFEEYQKGIIPADETAAFPKK